MAIPPPPPARRGAAAESVAQALGTTEFPRFRLGIGRPPPDWTVQRFVLTEFMDQRELVWPMPPSLGIPGSGWVESNGFGMLRFQRNVNALFPEPM